MPFLVVQNNERVDANKRVSYTVTFVEIDLKTGLCTDDPFEIWQRETPEGDVPSNLPFIADIEFGMRQYRNKEGIKVSDSYIKFFKNARAAKIT